RSYVRQVLWVDNAGRRVRPVAPPAAVAWDEVLTLAGEAPGARRVRIEHLGRRLVEAPVRDGRWQALVPAARLGLGVVELRAVAEWAEGPEARSAVLPVTVTLPTLLPASAAGGSAAGEGAKAAEKGGL